MKRIKRGIGLAGFLLFMGLHTPAAGEEIDRLWAVVNGAVITDGDLRLARNLNALLSIGKKLPAVSRAEEIDRLVDQEILRQELSSFPAIRSEAGELEAPMDDLRRVFAEIGGMPALLRRLGVQESELQRYISLRVNIEKFIRFRFEPFVSVTGEEIQSYYDTDFLPAARQKQIEPIPGVNAVSKEIEGILKEQKVSAALDRWLRDIRRSARVEMIAISEPLPGERKP